MTESEALELARVIDQGSQLIRLRWHDRADLDDRDVVRDAVRAYNRAHRGRT